MKLQSAVSFSFNNFLGRLESRRLAQYKRDQTPRNIHGSLTGLAQSSSITFHQLSKGSSKYIHTTPSTLLAHLTDKLAGS